jgi:hypothetical protein
MRLRVEKQQLCRATQKDVTRADCALVQRAIKERLEHLFDLTLVAQGGCGQCVGKRSVSRIRYSFHRLLKCGIEKAATREYQPDGVNCSNARLKAGGGC